MLSDDAKPARNTGQTDPSIFIKASLSDKVIIKCVEWCRSDITFPCLLNAIKFSISLKKKVRVCIP